MAWQLPTDLMNDTQGLLEGTALWASDVTFGFFWAGLLLGFIVVLTISTYRYGGDKAFGFGGVAGIFGSMILLILGLIPVWIATTIIILGSIAIAYMFYNR